MKHRLFALLLALATALVVTFPAGGANAAPAKRVYAGVYLHDVAKFEQKDGVFDVDLQLWVKWLGEFDPQKVRIANAAEVERELIGEESDGDWHSTRWRVKGTLRGEFPVHRFPFDVQTLSVVLEIPEAEGDLAPDLAGSGMKDHFSITGWLYDPSFVPRVEKKTYRSDLGTIANEGLTSAVNRVAFDVTVRRPPVTAATKLFVPLLVILLVAFVALFIHPRNLDVRSSVGVTALLACFAFHFAVSDTMPNVAYITAADLLFLIAYGLTAALLIVSVAAFALDQAGRETEWQKLNKGALVAFPIVLLLSVGLTLRDSSPPQPKSVAVLDNERSASSRDLLRVGINTLSSPMGGLPGRGANWGTVRTQLDGTRVAGLVEQVPSITNDSLRFLADGTLEVTWRLRPNLKWSDGKPLTAGDLEFALQVSPDPRIAEIKVADASTLVVRFKDRVAAAMENITPLPRHALEEVHKKGGFEAVRDFRRKNVLPSAGPYRILEFVEDDHVTLEANPHFVGAAPSIKRIEIKRYKEDKALAAAFEAGEIDMIAPNAISPEAASALAKKKPDSVTIRASEIFVYLYPDPKHPLLAKPEVRKALLMAFDRERIRRDVFGDSTSLTKLADVPIHEDVPKGITSTNYDLEAAKKVLEAAGAAGAKMPLIHASTPVDRAIAAELVKDAAAVGITLEPSEVKNVNDVYRKRDHGGLLLQSTTGDRESPPEKYWYLPQNEGRYDRSYRDDAYDDSASALVEREERALYPERRDQIRDLLFVEYSKRLPSLPMFFLVDRIAAVPDLKGWEQGSGTKFGISLERWHFAVAP